MKKLNRKGFTIIELVIVIAVIAILAAVMVPTFSSIVTKANESAAKQEAMAYYKEVYALDLSDGVIDAMENEKESVKTGEFQYTTTKGTEEAEGKNTMTVNMIDGEAVSNMSYTVKNNKVVEFSYKITKNSKEYTVKYDGTEWKVQ